MQRVGQIEQKTAKQIAWEVPAGARAPIRSPSFTIQESRAAHFRWENDTVEVVCRGPEPLAEDPKIACSTKDISVPAMGGSLHVDRTVHYTKHDVPRLDDATRLTIDLG